MVGIRFKISPIEQVELLTQLHADNLGFAAENTNAVKDSIQLFSSENSTFYGKTGTGRINDHDVNGWFIGFIETFDNTYFFATNIKADQRATGSNAAEITMSHIMRHGDLEIMSIYKLCSWFLIVQINCRIRQCLFPPHNHFLLSLLHPPPY